MHFSLVHPLWNPLHCVLFRSSIMTQVSSFVLNLFSCVCAFFYVVAILPCQYWNSTFGELVIWKCAVAKGFKISELDISCTNMEHYLWPFHTLNLNLKPLRICVGLISFCKYILHFLTKLIHNLIHFTISWVFNFHSNKFNKNDSFCYTSLNQFQFKCQCIHIHMHSPYIWYTWNIQMNMNMCWHICNICTWCKLKYNSHWHVLDLVKSHVKSYIYKSIQI